MFPIRLSLARFARQSPVSRRERRRVAERRREIEPLEARRLLSVATIEAPTSAVRGAPTAFVFAATDTPANPADVFTFDIDWDNNGSVDQSVVGLGTGTVVEHVFAATGAVEVSVTATNAEDETSAAATHGLNVIPYAKVANGGLFDLVVGGTTGNDFYSFWGLGGDDVGVIAGGDLGVFRVDGVTGKIIVHMQGGDDVVTVEAGMNGFDVDADLGDGFNVFVPIGGSNATYTVHGGDDVDQFFLVGAGNITTYFYGGGGDDVYLDVSASASNVTNFFGEAGDDGVAAGLGADFLNGGDGDDMLVGGFAPIDGDDTINGGAGDDFIVGGPGADHLDGGANQDFIVAGSLVFVPTITDGYLPIWAEWGSSGNSFATRVSHIAGASGGLNAPYYPAVGVSALDDGDVDEILGGSGEDWLVYRFDEDLASDYSSGVDVRTSIIPSATFDDLSLPPESAWNGPDPEGTVVEGPWGPIVEGSFTSGGVTFFNSFDSTFFTWGGFAYSNMSDTTTPGYGNQYSAYTGTGAGPGADNYAVAFGYLDTQPNLIQPFAFDPNDVSHLEQLPSFELPTGYEIDSVKVTNTTYAALAMLQGDSFAKKFGGESGNDADFLKVTAYGTDLNGIPLGVGVEFYLADYRFANNALDYVVDEWTIWDLSALSGATRIYFNVSSSDVGLFGVNTPTFFALDDIELEVV